MTITPDREISFIDKSTWGPGPWTSEPDTVQWQDPATDLVCLAVRNALMGNWCGYVGVPEGHPAFGLDYEAANRLADPDEDGYRAFRVHGALTFAATCQEGAGEGAVCHTPAPGQPEHVWWLGFDCAHGGDLVPGINAVLPERLVAGLSERAGYAYRTLAHVQDQCAQLAAQLRAVEQR